MRCKTRICAPRSAAPELALRIALLRMKFAITYSPKILYRVKFDTCIYSFYWKLKSSWSKKHVSWQILSFARRNVVFLFLSRFYQNRRYIWFAVHLHATRQCSLEINIFQTFRKIFKNRWNDREWVDMGQRHWSLRIPYTEKESGWLDNAGHANWWVYYTNAYKASYYVVHAIEINCIDCSS